MSIYSEYSISRELKSMEVPFAMPECGNEEIREIADVIKSGWLTTASRYAQFEKDFARLVIVLLRVSSGKWA